MSVMQNTIKILVIFFIHLLLIYYIKYFLTPIHYTNHNLLISELIGKNISFSFEFIVLMALGNLTLLSLIGLRFFKSYFGFIPVAVYSLSLWPIYLTISQSFYIYLLFIILLSYYGWLKMTDGKKWGLILMFLGIVIAIYSSFWLLLILPIFLLFLVSFNLKVWGKWPRDLLIMGVLTLPLIFFISYNFNGFKNVLNSEVRLFTDPGFVNNINQFQGEAQKQGYGKLSRISENKYIFGLEFSVLKYTKQLIPSTFFTSQEKLLNFSANPPIYLGFLLPFTIGLIEVIKIRKWHKFLALSTLLVVPSFFSGQSVDLNRLILFVPVVVFIIGYGFVWIYKKNHTRKGQLILLVSLLLVVAQLFITLSDIKTKENDRFNKYHDQNYILEKQSLSKKN